MAIPILQTKLYIPPPRPTFVHRPRLFELLDKGIDRKLTLIAAQAGAGKTTLVSDWIYAPQSKVDETDSGIAANRADRTSTEIVNRVAWLSLDEADSDPARFWLYVIAALQTICPDVGCSAQTMLEAPVEPAFDALLTSLINEIAASSSRIILVLDDYHFISAAEAHRTLNFLLDHLPPQLHLVLLTREDPPLPLARLRVQQQMTEIRIEHLRFTNAEAHHFLHETMGLTLPPAEVEALQRRTEGWVAGLQMAALSLQYLSDASHFVEHFSGDDRHLVDYLMAEVIARQTPQVQAFLLQTAILDRLTASLCNAVTGRRDSRALLTQLEQANLFLIPLDNRRGWHRYHRLFGDLLRYRLHEEYEPAQVRELHRRAARWCAEHHLIGEAVDHYLAAEEFAATAELIESVGIHWIVRGQLRQVLDWLGRLPNKFLRTRPMLCVCRAWALNVTGQAAEVEQHLADAEEALPNAPAAQHKGICALISTMRAYLARRQQDVGGSMQLLRQALAGLPADNLIVRSTINLNLGFNYAIMGEIALADQALAAAVAEGQQCEAIFIVLIALALRGNVYVAQGKLQAAKQFYQECIERGLAQNSGRPFPPAGYAYAGLGQVLYEQNDLAGAEAHLRQAVACGELSGDWSMTRRGLLPLAWLKQMQGEAQSAHSLWQRALSVVQQAESRRVQAQLSVQQARLWLAEANGSPRDATSLARVARWAGSYQRTQPDPQLYPEALAQMTVAWFDLLQGDGDNTLAWLAPIRQAAEANGQIDNLIKVLALQALARFTCGDLASAFDDLQRALDLAAPEGYMRTFLDYGAPMQRLLQQAAARGIAPDYIATLLSTSCNEDMLSAATPTESSIPNLIEPLNAREQQILHLMAARLSNQQIADELHLSINTVKWHARNIFGKLQVSNRVEAVDRARAISLI